LGNDDPRLRQPWLYVLPAQDEAGIQNEAGIDGRLIVYWELIEEPPLGGLLI
jgi:hypothetical protein